MQLPTFASLNLLAILPVLLLLLWACVLMVVDLFIPAGRKQWTAWLAVLGLVGAGVLTLSELTGYITTGASEAFGGMLTIDGFALFVQLTVLLAAIIGILIALNYLSRQGFDRGEYYTLLLFTTSGMMVMALASDLIVVFLALELLSIPLYVLAGFARPRLESEESAMKYFLLGAFASGFLVYGIALTYGGTGTTALSGVVDALAGEAVNLPLAIAGMGLMLVGLGFKVAAVPFHMWTPDVYQGAPTPVTGFMSVGAKAGGFAALLRVLVIAFPALSDTWGIMIAVIAALTMIMGNFVAISQTNIKRMLAYSSIAHAGYILVAVAAAQYTDDTAMAVGAALFYLLTYTFTNLGAFGVVIALEKDDGTGINLEDFAGLGRTRPGLALAMALFMLSLTGMPPSAGMVGKFFVFQAAVSAARGDPFLLAVTIIGVLTSVISAFYYIRVIVIMYMQEGEGKATLQPALSAALIITAAVTFVLGIVPGPVFRLAQQALLELVG